MTSGGEPSFGVYIHWPFCAAKCPYCDFNSHVRRHPPDQKRFAAAFAREIETIAARSPGRTVSSIFLGGGTPSLMEPATVGAILDAVAAHWAVAAAAEVTLEANPSSVEPGRFRGYRTAGVNRVSLGVQALASIGSRSASRRSTTVTSGFSAGCMTLPTRWPQSKSPARLSRGCPSISSMHVPVRRRRSGRWSSSRRSDGRPTTCRCTS